MIVAFNLVALRVDASTTYTRGIVKSSSKITNAGGSQLKSDTGGSIYLYNPEAVEVLGEVGSSYKIKFMYSGFIYEGYIKKGNVTVKTYTTDDAYEQEMITKGFPDDYARKLAILHAIHPNWSFMPSNTGKIAGGLDFKTAVEGEARVVSTNLIQTSNNSLKSTADGAYQNGVWIDLSGKGWHAASKQTIAFFMDPRNFLDESHIFMFENLGFNPATQKKEVVDKIIGGTFMSNPFDCIVGSNECILGTHYFNDTFMEIGRSRNVSPVHLASRVLQEQGSKGSVLSLGKGWNGEYIGYYNFFNVNASGKTNDEVITNGLKYAHDRGWNNPYYSIYGGSSLIANSYIGRGQSTGYYQKFNTIVPSYYTWQYMQNVKAPYSEAYTTYTSYYKAHSSLEEWDNEVYDFLIPIYSNMGEYTTLDASQNGDSTLKSLNITNCQLNPDFLSSAYSYECYVEDGIEEIEVTAETTNANATLANPGKVKIEEKETTIDLVVTAVNGQSSTYSVHIKKIEKDTSTPIEILNNIGLKVNEDYVSNIEVGMDVSNIINGIKGKHHFASMKMFDASGKELNEGIVKTGYKISVKNNGVEKAFDVVVFGDNNGDGLIDIRDLLSLQKHLVSSKALTDAYFKASDINKDGLVDIRDLLLVQKQLVGAYTINQG